MSAHHRRSLGAVRAVTVVVLGAVVVGCGDGDPAPGAVPPDAEEPATTVAVTEPPGFDIDPSVPDDPADLQSCDAIDTPVDRQLPARWIPTSLPDGVDIATAGTTRRVLRGDAATPTPGAGLVVLVSTDASSGDGAAPTVVAEAVVELEPLDDPGGGPTGFAPDTTLRGVPAELGASDSVGPAGVVVARWVEDGDAWTVEASGLDEDEVVDLVERLERSDSDVVDPNGRFRSIATSPGRYPAVRTEVGLAAVGAAPREYGLVVEEHHVAEEHGGGSGLPVITGLVPRTGLELGELDGRPALRGELGGSQVLMTTTTEGAAVYAYGAFDADELDDVIGSLERVDPDDERLVGVPMDWVNGSDRFCREDR